MQGIKIAFTIQLNVTFFGILYDTHKINIFIEHTQKLAHVIDSMFELTANLFYLLLHKKTPFYNIIIIEYNTTLNLLY